MRLSALIFASLLLAACAQSPRQPPADPSLYQALGGKPGITRLVEAMLINVAQDPRIVSHFKNVDPVRLRDKLVEKFCVETGGPCVYSGDSMAEAHKGQNISKAEFNALVEDLLKAMDSQGVPVPVQNRLIARLAPQREEVIHK
ncbi:MULTISPECIES: group 1 truncated hemoglobin [unclassified Pseudomonas]|uniref:group I truncated hemoglobin n=1 Tax=unclassified Pseudomonas TaxID=196821 RepID=UPI000BC66C5A|nr:MULTISPECIES: group 1 truncated hemoglobin [unclassified Pseudomonas]PVZ20592.1 hemoglobin [Pseudomonas sp. URIL14HWK12:I12]PVZ27658.1 hemoglobin [Pseudomonas sp. URIL14HWK12:I10]PVZ38547.1 hemoglobin [Pseudomonas sp. URIL14HWK12:I11]SNZ02925.1 hemoglobin [Pseudomonas sp. URIL14HWK12:I9]